MEKDFCFKIVSNNKNILTCLDEATTSSPLIPVEKA